MRAERTPHALGHALGAFRSLSRPSLVWSSSGERTSPGYVTLDGSPGGQLAVNPNTASVYVPIACTDGNACDQTAQNVVDVLSSTTCTASVRLDCGVVATAFLGANGEEPVSAIVDPRTDTVYVGNAGIASASPPVPPSISVLDGATCNASVTSGCSEPLATIELTGFPAALALDPATGTLYVASPFPAGAIFVIDAAGCNATTTTGCTNAVKTINDSPGPNGIALDTTTNTVYAANSPPNGSGSVSVVNGSICNAVESSGCNQNPPTITVGIDPFWDVVDQATHTVYVANHGSGTVSVINGATCNATNKSGCNQTPPAVTTGPGPSFVSLDASRHTVFTLNEQADTMSAIDTSSCNGASTLGCPKPARDQALPFNPPQGGNPNVFAFVAQTGTAYLVTAGGESLLQPANITGCSAVDTITCRAVKPTVPQPLFFPVVDSTTHTIYAGDMFLPQIDVLNSDTCQPAHLSGCALVAKIPMPDPQANLNAIDETTHTLYAADPFGDTISVINTAHVQRDRHRRLRERHAKDHHRLLSGTAAARHRHAHPVHHLRQPPQRLRGPTRRDQRRHLQQQAHERLRRLPLLRAHPRTSIPVRAQPGHEHALRPQHLERHGLSDQNRTLQRQRPFRLRSRSQCPGRVSSLRGRGQRLHSHGLRRQRRVR